LLNEKTAR